MSEGELGLREEALLARPREQILSVAKIESTKTSGAPTRDTASPAERRPRRFYDLIAEQWLLPPMSDAAQELPLAS